MQVQVRSQVGRLRVRGAPQDAPAARIRASRCVAGAQLEPAGLPPSSLLVIRQLETPAATGLFAAAPLRRDRIWELALKRRVEDRARAATRPRRGRVPPDAAAVFFEDMSEFLACLALHLSGRGAVAWWWEWARDARPELVEGSVAAVFLEEAERLPAVARHLEDWRVATKVFASLTGPEVGRILGRLAASYGLRLPQGEETPSPTTMPTLQEGPGAVTPRFPSPTAPSPPWRRWSPAPSSSATPEQDMLLGLALGLFHRPAEVRSRAFSGSLAEWRRATQAAPGTAGPDPEGLATALPAALRQRLPVTRPSPRAPDGHPPPAEAGRSTLPNRGADPLAVARPPREPAVQGWPRGPAEGDPERDRDRPVPTASLPKPHPSPAAGEVGEASVPGAAPLSPAPARSARFGEECITTSFGGVLYLLNLLRHLDLPGGFGGAWSLDAVGGWALLETLARALLQELEATADDVLWAALAELDGREPGTPPQVALPEDAEYRLPTSWWLEDPEADPPVLWGSTRRWLRVWSSYLIAEVRRDGSPPSRQAVEILERLGPGNRRLRRAPFGQAPLASWRSPAGPRWPAGLVRWTERVTPYCLTRLRHALSPVGEGDEALLAMLRTPARLFLSSSHVDLTVRLDDISLPARRAGLDRDPGWDPGLGRVVLFHFE